MGRLEVAVHRGALLQLYEAMWGPLYEAVLSILGSTGVVLPIGDRRHGQPNASIFTTVGEEQVTFTWSEAPNAFDKALDLTDPASYQGIIPVVKFNGTDEEADTPDAAYWSRAGGAMSIGLWVKMKDATASTLLCKTQSSGDNHEWLFQLDASGKLEIRLWDEDDATTPNATIKTIAQVATSQDVWHFVVATYDGSADATGLNLYQDGVLWASDDTDDANFVSLRDTGTTVKLGHTNLTPASLFDGYMAGGPLGPFFTQKELTADEVLRLSDIGRRALTL